MAKSKSDWIWWKHGVIYHIYTRSFKDSNNDGIGDIVGIIEKLDYLADLGIDGIWLSPVYQSPMSDFGYDISDYKSIDPTFGTIAEFKLLIAEAHKRDIRIIMDMVMNHTSDQHPWFIESRSSKDNLKRDWYIWKEGKNGFAPNNWKSTFGRSAWEKDSATNQYYLHSFLKEQPDLNWRNKELRNVFFDEIRFWLELGVDGFRLDVINLIAKDKKFRNNPGWLSFLGLQKPRFTRNRGRSYKIVSKLRALVDQYPDKMLVGEILTLPPGNSSIAASYLGDGQNMLNMAFDFSLIFRRWHAQSYFKTIQNWYNHIPSKGWPCHVLSNHDLYRSLNRLGIGNDKLEKAKVAAVLLLTLRGTPFLYYGEEIGMENIKLSRKDVQDPLGKKFWPIFTGRDQARSPMQWDAGLNSGFSNSTPWLPLSKKFKEVNVQEQMRNSESLLNLYKKLILLRKESIAIQSGKWIPFIKGNNDVIAYFRKKKKEKYLIILNFKAQQKAIQLSKKDYWKVALSSAKRSAGDVVHQNIRLNKLEALVLKQIPNNSK